ncbi:MAG: sulfotransferase domain-containing protein [Pirellulales bacterium]
MLMIACFPKSGSTYLMRLLCEITGFKRAILVPYRGPNEQDLSKILLDEHRWRDGVCQQHLKATYYNLELLRKHNIRVVVLLRNIYDVVVSLCDHIDNGGPLMPTGYTPEQFSQWPQERKWMFLIRVHIPWYFSFLMSWHEGQHQVPVHWLTYEELFEDQQDTVRQLLGFWDVPRTSEEIAHGLEAVQSQFTRFNQGVAGRGSVLPVEHKRAIAELADLCDVAPELRRRVGLETHELQSSADR